MLQRLPSSGGALNSRFNNSGNFGNPPDGGGVGAGAAEVDLRYLGSRRDARAGRRPALRQRRLGERRARLDRPQLHSRRHDRAGRGAAGRRLVDLRLGRDRRRRQHHHPPPARTGFLASAQLGVFGEGDGFTQNYQLSWGIGNRDDSGTRIVIGANYVKQDEVSSADRDISQFPTPGTTACDTTCSSGTPNGRFIVLGQDLTLIAPVHRPDADAGRLSGRLPAPPTASTSRRSTSSRSRSSATAPSSTSPRSWARTSSSICAALYNRRNSSQPGGASAAVRRPRRRQRQSARHDLIDATNPFNPFGRCATTRHAATGTYAFIGRRVVENGPRRYDQEVDTYYVAGTLDGYVRAVRPRLVLGRQRRLGPQQGRAGRCTATSTPPTSPARSARSRPAPRPACRSTSSAARARSPRRCSIMSPSPSATAASRSCGTSPPTSPAACSTCPAGRPASRSASSIATRAASSIPIRSSPPASARTSRRCRPRAATMSTRPMPNCGCRCSRDTDFFHRLELTGAARYSDYSTSGSTTTFSAGINWEPIEDLLFRGSWAEGFRAPEHRRAVRHAVALRPGGRRSLLGRRHGGATPADGPRQLHRRGRPRQRQLRPVQRAAAGGDRRQSRISSRRTSESWGVGAVWRPSLPAAAVARGQLFQHPGRRRDPGDRRRRPCSAAARTLGDAAELRRDRPHRLGPGHRRSAASCRTSPASRPTASTSPSTTAARATGCGDVRPVLDQHLPVQLHGHRPGDGRRHRDRARGHRAGQPRPGLPRSSSRPRSSTGRRTISAPR